MCLFLQLEDVYGYKQLWDVYSQALLMYYKQSQLSKLLVFSVKFKWLWVKTIVNICEWDSEP